ncbi:MAG: hypothetical protein JXQ73_02540 [Phycisphaerae bacterium]|nr:hypothetical protein [Phycisphaerae bacterium]
MSRFPMSVLTLTLVAASSRTHAAPDLSISAVPYLTGGLFTKPILPAEGDCVVITVRASLTGAIDSDPSAKLTLLSPDGRTVAERTLQLKPAKDCAEATWTWQAGANGIYKVRVQVDPDNKIAESDETNNAADLVLPVLVKGRKLHFPWYREEPLSRWTTCVTSVGDPNHQVRLAERGVIPLRWEYGGMSWSYYDKEKAKTHPHEVLKDLEELFYKKYTSKADVPGFGMDEFGGYPGSWKEKASIASLKALARAKQEMPDRFFAAWNGGGLNPKMATYYRMGADLLLLETYLWRATPMDLKVEEIYQLIEDRLSPVIRSRDMIVPAYGNHCYTLIALDTSERPDWIPLGEQENVVRYVRRLCPEMRGIAWYNGGYGGYGLVKTPETDKIHQAVLDNADRLCFDCFIRPCVTLMRHGLWIDTGPGGARSLVAAVSNIGAIDSGPVSVEFLVDGKTVGTETASRIPAGPNRNVNRVLLRRTLSITPGFHAYEARIVSAKDATTLDAVARCSRLIP